MSIWWGTEWLYSAFTLTLPGGYCFYVYLTSEVLLLREVDDPDQSSLANQWQSQESNPHLFIPESVLYFIYCKIAPLMEKAMAPHSSTLAWRIPWTEEPGRLQSMGLWRVRHHWVTSLSLFTFMHWRRKWQPTPVFLPGESQGWGSLVGCRLWGRTELDTTEVMQQQQQQQQHADCCKVIPHYSFDSYFSDN